MTKIANKYNSIEPFMYGIIVINRQKLCPKVLVDGMDYKPDTVHKPSVA